MLEKLIAELKEGKYFHGSVWSLDWYLDEIFCDAMFYGRDPIFINYKQIIVGDEFSNPINYMDISKSFLGYIEDDKKSKDLIEKQNKIKNKAIDFLKKIKSEDYFDLNIYYDIQYDLALLMASVSCVFDGQINELIPKIAAKEKISEYALSAYIIDKSSETKMQESNQKLLALYKKNSNIKAIDLVDHAQKYGWMNTAERGKKVWTEKDFYKQLKSLITSSKATKQKEIKLNSRSKIIIERIIQINRNDNMAIDLQTELDFCFQNYLKNKIGKEYDESIIEQLTFEEIKLILNKEKRILDYSDRRNNYNRVLFQNDGKVFSFYLTEKEFIKISKLLISPKIINTVIKGSVACQGKAEGKVRLIQKMDDLKDFQSGEIMVASQTQPNYVPYMTKAKAIITDEGGITSHAAIISREFNIPCIVGTQNATSILKNGDYIIVDAISGVIEKIK